MGNGGRRGQREDMLSIHKCIPYVQAIVLHCGELGFCLVLCFPVPEHACIPSFFVGRSRPGFWVLPHTLTPPTYKAYTAPRPAQTQSLYPLMSWSACGGVGALSFKAGCSPGGRRCNKRRANACHICHVPSTTPQTTLHDRHARSSSERMTRRRNRGAFTCGGGDVARWGGGDGVVAIQKGKENGGTEMVLPALYLPH